MDKNNFVNSSVDLTSRDIESIEKEIGQDIPDVLKDFYLLHNGGELEGGRCVFVEEKSDSEYNINTFLPIKYKRFEEDYLLEECFRSFVIDKKLMPAKFIPFAIDGGGYPFALNTDDLSVSICYVEDLKEKNQPMRFVTNSLENFIKAIVTEKEAYQ